MNWNHKCRFWRKSHFQDIGIACKNRPRPIGCCCANSSERLKGEWCFFSCKSKVFCWNFDPMTKTFVPNVMEIHPAVTTTTAPPPPLPSRWHRGDGAVWQNSLSHICAPWIAKRGVEINPRIHRWKLPPSIRKAWRMYGGGLRAAEERSVLAPMLPSVCRVADFINALMLLRATLNENDQQSALLIKVSFPQCPH